MINTIEALQGLYVALGGELSDVANITTIPEMLTAISTVAAAGASELPAVKSADNGNVLTVVSGKWAKATPVTELPAVTAADNGKVLKVIDGAWSIGDVSYKISYNANGGSGTAPDSYVIAGDRVKLPANMGTPPGSKIFAGWALTPDSATPDYPVGAYMTPTASVTLYAFWQEEI